MPSFSVAESTVNHNFTTEFIENYNIIYFLLLSANPDDAGS